jgi:antitoxin (DNA-binding transcriptional repressor) of toxin-antitoxin stability system
MGHLQHVKNTDATCAQRFAIKSRNDYIMKTNDCNMSRKLLQHQYTTMATSKKQCKEGEEPALVAGGAIIVGAPTRPAAELVPRRRPETRRQGLRFATGEHLRQGPSAARRRGHLQPQGAPAWGTAADGAKQAHGSPAPGGGGSPALQQ